MVLGTPKILPQEWSHYIRNILQYTIYLSVYVVGGSHAAGFKREFVNA